MNILRQHFSNKTSKGIKYKESLLVSTPLELLEIVIIILEPLEQTILYVKVE
jgi:hypothetical protein